MLVMLRTPRHTRVRAAAAVCVLTLTTLHAPVMAPRGHAPSRPEGASSSRTRAATNPVLRTVHVAANPLALVVDAPTRRVFVFSATTHESRVSVLDAVTGALLHTLRLGRQAFILTADGVPLPAVVDPRTGQVFVPTSGQDDVTIYPHGPGRVWVLDGRTGAVRRVVPVGYAPHAVVIDGRTRRVFVCNSTHMNASYVVLSEATLSVLSAETGAVVRTVPHLDLSPLAVDERTGRIFAFGDSLFVLDATTAAVRTRRPYSVLSRDVGAVPSDIAVDARAGRMLVSLVDTLGLTDGVLLDATTGAVVARAPALGDPMAVDEIDGRVVSVIQPVSSTGGPVLVNTLATRTGTLIRSVTIDSIRTPAEAAAVAVDERTHRLFVVNQPPGQPMQLGILDAASGRLVSSVGLEVGQPVIAVDAQTARVFVANTGDGTVSVLDAARL